MRKKHIIAAAAAAACLILSGSLFLLLHDKPEEQPTLSQVVEEKFNAYETDLRDSLGSMNSNNDVGSKEIFQFQWCKIVQTYELCRCKWCGCSWREWQRIVVATVI